MQALAEINKTADDLSVKRLVEIQAQMEETDSRFATRWLGISGTSWYRLKAGDYQANPKRLLEKCQAAVRVLDDYLAAIEHAGPGGRTLPLRPVRNLINAVKVAQVQPRDRLVMFTAPTGGGKSGAVRALQERYGVRVVAVEAMESWRKSYLSAIIGIASGIGLKDLDPSVRLAESALINELRARPCILAIDEGHYFGPESLNLIKAILNQTQCVVVLLAIPSLVAKMKRQAYEESQQLRSRTCASVEISRVDESDLDTFLQDRLPAAKNALGDAWKPALSLLAEAANRFGLWDTVEFVCQEIRDESEGGPVTLEMVRSSVATVSRARK